ncbi:MAG: NAD-dependent epimerase/dehydratase family protein [Planctomycetes bacterium]|jgi:NADH dehydrogenase|nr:NAD-dependent epimerase/dehydratase family protein [Planctomycetota bacterium]
MRIAVTGAFGYSGRYIAKRLLDAGHEVVTLTNSLRRPDPFGGRVPAFPFHFDDPGKLRESLRTTQALVNTYWVRFDHRLFTHDQAVANTKVLFAAAREAGVRRIVHVSITNPDAASDLPYFRGKAELEAHLRGLEVPFAILRPTVLFGKEDVLINNIAWSLRHLPVVGVFGAGNYRLQPIHVDDLAEAAARMATESDDRIVEAIGPEAFTYRGLVAAVARAIGVRRPIVPVPPAIGYWSGRLIGLCVRDVVVTREEIRGLMEGRLFVDAPPLGTTRLTEWMARHRERLGRRYTSEMARRVDRTSAYRSN